MAVDEDDHIDSLSASTVDSRESVDSRPGDWRTVDWRTVDWRTVDSRTVDSRTVDSRPVDSRTVDSRSSLHHCGVEGQEGL